MPKSEPTTETTAETDAVAEAEVTAQTDMSQAAESSDLAGFFNLPNDSFVKTIGMALLVCLVCSVVVSTAATVLKPLQIANKALDKKKNILSVAGIQDESKTVDELFQQIETRTVDFATGEYTDAVAAESYDQLKASKDPSFRVALTSQQDVARISARAKYGSVYLVKSDQQISKIVIPVRGYGLWSTLHGFLALEADGTTVSGITFYDHKETPGLGGEIDNKKWQSSWQSKQLFNAAGQAALSVIKGSVNPQSADAEYQVDGLAGATLTSNGVTNLIKFWAGENGYGPFLQKMRNNSSSQVLLREPAERPDSHLSVNQPVNQDNAINSKSSLTETETDSRG